MPDAQGEPTEVETIQALGWDAAPTSAPESFDAAQDERSRIPYADDSAAPVAGAPPAPSGTPSAPVAATPAPPPRPVYTPPAPAPDPIAQQREVELGQLRQQQVISQINQEAQQYKNNLLGQGWDDAQAHEAATQFAQNRYNGHVNQETRRVANEQAKTAKAYELSHQYGVPVETLRAYNDPASMEQAAKFYAETTGKINELTAKVNANNKAPVQTFDSNTQSSSGSPRALKLRYATDPNFNPTDEQLARIMGG